MIKWIKDLSIQSTIYAIICVSMPSLDIYLWGKCLLIFICVPLLLDFRVYMECKLSEIKIVNDIMVKFEVQVIPLKEQFKYIRSIVKKV